MAENNVSKEEFNEHRQEMRSYMATQTNLMSQMVELQTKHLHLESRVNRNERDIDDIEKRVRPLESNQGGTDAKTQYNRNLIWLVLSMIMGIAGYALRGGL